MSRTLNPRKCALLVIDMQHRFDPVAQSIASRLASFARACLDKNMPVFMTQHHDKKDTETELTKFWGDDIRIAKGSFDWSFMSEMESLSKLPGVTVIDDKTAYDAFYNTSLEENLRKLGIEQVLITGAVTNLCCETTARAAMIHDFQVFFVQDLNAAASSAHQKATITNLSYGFATITTEQNVCALLDS